MNELETFWTPEPIYGLKRYIKDYNSSKLVSARGTYHSVGVLETAICKPMNWTDRHNNPVTVMCSGPVPAEYHLINYGDNGLMNESRNTLCGFYGYSVLQQCLQWTCECEKCVRSRKNLFLVEFSGRIIEHEKGYRAERQRIIREIGNDEIVSIMSARKDEEWISASQFV